MLDEIRGALYIAKKDLKEYYLKPPTVSWGIAFPLVFAFAFMLRGWDKLWLASGLLTLSLFFGSTSMSAASIVFERRMKSFERLLLFPISYFGVAWGKSLSSFFFGLLSSIPTVAIIQLFLSISPHNPALLALCIVGSALQFSSMGVLLAFAVKDPAQAMTIFNTIRFPMIFLCDVIIPVSKLPKYLSPISLAMPLTYSVEAIRYALAGNYDIMPPQISIPITFISFFAFLYLAEVLIKRSIP